ncbi:MAG: hypothetical protein B7Z39_00080 [Novosphingobium sp. 12-64-8]|nr:MAG: hypothetical protein B7Z39_00080 [Novosphingobium sp. 12-64-8]
MKSVNLKTFAIGFVLFTLSCSGPSTNSSDGSQGNSKEEIAKFENYSPFPNATSVRLFVQSETFDEGGIDGLRDARGRLLTSKETELLKSAFSKKTVIRPPAEGYVDTACAFVPRHVFRFFDKRNKRLGDALVCFECYEVELQPPGALAEVSFPKQGQSFLKVDYSILETLLREMKVPTYADQ